MKHNPTFRSLVLMVILMPLLVLTGCSDNGSSNFFAGGTTAVIPGVNPAFDSIDEVALSPDPGGPYDDVLEVDTDYTYDPATESITPNGSVGAGQYVSITGMATVTGVTSSYTIYTYISGRGDEVAANELTSAAVALVASGDAADFDEALGLVETAFGLPAGSVAAPTMAGARSAQLTSVLAAAAPGFVGGAFDVTDFGAADLGTSQMDYQDCIALGGMAWDSWHKTDAGGSGLPTDEDNNNYTRCKACHGWDQQGTDGGYVFRSRKSSRPNAGYQDPNNCDLPMADPLTCTRSRNISTDTTFGGDYNGSAIEILAGGRTWEEGSMVFDELWGPGAILGNRHPDLGPDNPEGPTADQLSCLTAFLNAPAARADQVYSAMETMPVDGKPAIYTPVATADAAAGATYYGTNCSGCHGDPSDDSSGATDGKPGTGGLIGYLNGDGKFSEFMHKMHWGIPNSTMSRAAMGDPTAADVADVVAHMQAVPFMELTAAQVVPAVAGITTRGVGFYTLTETGLEYIITIDGALSSPITAAHFHLARVGVNNAESLHTLNDFVDGQSQGVWLAPSPAERTALLAGNVYVVIHTEDNIPGEIRGQVEVVEGTGNQPPTACFDVTPSLNVEPAILVTLDAGCSIDPDFGPSPLTYGWILTVPVGSTTAVLSSDDTVGSSFTPDVEGSYEIDLTVNDGLVESSAGQTVTVAIVVAGDIADGMALYDASCSGCHDAGAHDTSGSPFGDISGSAP